MRQRIAVLLYLAAIRLEPRIAIWLTLQVQAAAEQGIIVGQQALLQHQDAAARVASRQ